jgi:hypothetical protein
LLNNEYDLPVSMFVWYSDELAARHPEKVAAARANAGRPLTTRSVFYSLLQMADIRLPDPQISRFGVFSTELDAYPRIVQAHPKPMDFDRSELAKHTRRTSLSAPSREAAPRL